MSGGGDRKSRSTFDISVFESGLRGQVLNLERDNIGFVLFGDDRYVKENDFVFRGYEIVSIPAGTEVLGRVLSPLGDPLDRGPKLKSKKSQIEVKHREKKGKINNIMSLASGSHGR